MGEGPVREENHHERKKKKRPSGCSRERVIAHLFKVIKGETPKSLYEGDLQSQNIPEKWRRKKVTRIIRVEID